MTQLLEAAPPQASVEVDLVTAIQQVLQNSEEPLTLSKIRTQLPRARKLELEELADVLRRQVAANVLCQYPKYRSQHDRFWDRPMPVHVAALLRSALQGGPLAWSVLRRKLPAYAQAQAEPVLQEQIAQRSVHRHPKLGRGGERFGLRPADAKDYLRSALAQLFQDLDQLGFTREQLRAGALELLHEEEWDVTPQTSVEAPSVESAEAQP